MLSIIRLGILLIAFFVASGASGQTSAADWNQWRGPGRDGRAPASAEAWRDDLKTLNVRWKAELGPSYSGPLVVGDLIITTQTQGEQTEVVHAYDRKNGKERWRAEWAGAMEVPFFAKANGDWIRATPASDGENLFVAGMRDVLVCLNARDGTERWRVDFTDRYRTPLPAFGFVSSPLVDGEHLYVQAGAAVVKLNKRNGESVWRSLDDGGGMWGSAFSSPALLELAGRRQLVVQTRTELCGVDPSSGDPLWKREIPTFRGMNILSPVAVGSQLFTSTYGGKTLCFDVTASGGALKLEERWSANTQGYMSTPVVHEGHVYVHLRNQRFACFELATGKERWRSGSFGRYCSLVAQGDRILALDERGELLLIRATPERFELLDRRKVSESETWAHLAVSGGEVVVRSLKELLVLAWD